MYMCVCIHWNIEKNQILKIIFKSWDRHVYVNRSTSKDAKQEQPKISVRYIIIKIVKVKSKKKIQKAIRENTTNIQKIPKEHEARMEWQYISKC